MTAGGPKARSLLRKLSFSEFGDLGLNFVASLSPWADSGTILPMLTKIYFTVILMSVYVQKSSA